METEDESRVVSKSASMQSKGSGLLGETRELCSLGKEGLSTCARGRETCSTHQISVIDRAAMTLFVFIVLEGVWELKL